jgi:hypothetical protein
MRDACFALTEQASEDARPAHLVLVHSDCAGRFGPRRSFCLMSIARRHASDVWPSLPLMPYVGLRRSRRRAQGAAVPSGKPSVVEDRRWPEALDDQVDRKRRLEGALGAVAEAPGGSPARCGSGTRSGSRAPRRCRTHPDPGRAVRATAARPNAAHGSRLHGYSSTPARGRARHRAVEVAAPPASHPSAYACDAETVRATGVPPSARHPRRIRSACGSLSSRRDLQRSRDALGPGANLAPVAIVAEATPQSPEEQPREERPLVSVDDSGKDAVVARVNGPPEVAIPLGSLFINGPMRRFRSPNVPTLNSHTGRLASAPRLVRTNSSPSGSLAFRL